ncbi:MAG TPA: hypothetical protein VJM31_15010 [Vicinamibacterales bacterium]|nr:hypothetical protein [Vicinamibacterales bacterium]
MNSVDRVNRELARLDCELRAGGIDRASFRAQRRQLLLDFEERETTTQPAAGMVPGSGNETTLVDPPNEPEPFVFPEPAAAAAPGQSTTPKTKRSIAGIAISAIGAVVVLAMAGWWFARPKPETPAVLTPPPTAAGPETSPTFAGADTPQSLAAALTESAWTSADVAEFLRRWELLPPEAIAAATEDSRIWLLRGETGRRLREARETASLDESVESQARVQQLELVQKAVGTP